MGCFWSSDKSQREGYSYGRNTKKEETVASASVSESFHSWALENQPCYGEYHCSCGRSWESRLSWRNKYQNCMVCRKEVTASYQRKLRPSDFKGVSKTHEEHPRELCPVCQEWGQYCGTYKQGIPSSNGSKGKRGPQKSKHTPTYRPFYRHGGPFSSGFKCKWGSQRPSKHTNNYRPRDPFGNGFKARRSTQRPHKYTTKRY